jgi:RimJ/RimL family protein N-acetyltransferase
VNPKILIETPRLHLRELGEEDVTDRYLEWLTEETARRYIVAATRTHTRADLLQYVRERAGRPDVLFLGLFNRENGAHIGNIKYEPVDSARGVATMGILIGEIAYRSCGYAGEAIRASALWLQSNRSIRRILLGVDRENAAAIRAYQKIGFVAAPASEIPETAATMSMIWSL